MCHHNFAILSPILININANKANYEYEFSAIEKCVNIYIERRLQNKYP